MPHVEMNGLIGTKPMAEAANAAKKHAGRELVERARGGDQEAFGELVRAHRAEAYGWANRIARDAFLAEDIVQDALIRAFLHIGTLADTRRFLPWLQTIIRNQAYMKLRRGGPYGKERTFTSLAAQSGYSDDHAAGESDAMDWGDIDRILFRMSRSAVREAYRSEDMAGGMLRMELMEQLRALLHGLTKRERHVFEAHFFGELPPGEIARLFDTTTANVYNLLSRSRAKVQKERIRFAIRLYVKHRAETGQRRVHILRSPQM